MGIACPLLLVLILPSCVWQFVVGVGGCCVGGVVYLLLRSLLVVNDLRLIFVCLRVVCGLYCVVGLLRMLVVLRYVWVTGLRCCFCCLFTVIYVVVLRGC